MTPPPDYQVIVVGAGVVGAALALALARAGLRVAVIERQATKAYQRGQEYGLRVSAISLASEYLFHNIGVWEEVVAARVSTYRQMYVWDARGKGSINFDCVDLQLEHLGHIVENDLIQTVLQRTLRQFNNVDFICPTEINDMQYGPNFVSLQLQDGGMLQAQLIAAADGAESLLRQKAGIAVDAWPYRQQAIVAVVQPTESHKATAWQRFLPNGPLALLPLSEGLCSIVWSTTDQKAEKLLAMDDDAFCKELHQASENCLGEFKLHGPRACFPLRYQHAQSYIKERFVLLGDAAHVVHPLAGQGVNLGLLDAVQLAGLVTHAHQQNKDIGATKLLRCYQRSRRSENQIMALAFDAMNRLFGADSESVIGLRNAGLSMAQHLPFLKRFLMLQATGLNSALRPSARKNTVRQGCSLLIPPDYVDI